MGRIVELAVRRRIPAVGLPRRPRGNTARRSRRHPGDLRREPPHPRSVRRLRGRRVPGGGAGALRPLPERCRLGLHAGGHRARTRVARPCGQRRRHWRTSPPRVRWRRPPGTSARSATAGAGCSRGSRRPAWTASRARSPTTAAECPMRSARHPVARCMAHFGEQDAMIPLAGVRALAAAHPAVEVFTYDAGHGFNCDERGSFDAASAQRRARTHARVPAPVRRLAAGGQTATGAFSAGWLW